jgi:Amt family ammonium transporter
LTRNPQLTAEDTNPNAAFNAGDQAYIIVASAMVLLMVPGIAFLYSGLARRKSALSLIWVTMMSFSVIIFQWYFWGYSLAFSNTATNGFIGNLDKFGLMNALGDPSPGSPLVPELLYSFFQVRERLPFPGTNRARSIWLTTEFPRCNSAPSQQPS